MTYTTFESGLRDFPEPAFDWQPDAERLEREVRVAELKGKRDELSLAEIECSLDLIDAELASLRRSSVGNRPPKLRELTGIRERLATLAMRLERLPV